jgi:hypothetical protein
MSGRDDEAERVEQLEFESLSELARIRAQSRRDESGTRICALESCSAPVSAGAKFCCSQHRARFHNARRGRGRG